MSRSSGSRSGSASGDRPRRSTRTTSSSPAQPGCVVSSASIAAPARPGQAGGLDVGEQHALEAHRRERHELDLGTAGGVDLDDERALGAGLAHVVRREAAGIPRGRLRPDLLALVHVAERPVRIAAVELLGRAGRVALARAGSAVDLGVQHRDRGGARRRRHQLGQVGALVRARVADRDDVPERSAIGIGQRHHDGLVGQRERAARLRQRRQCSARVVVAAGHDHGRARLGHARELRQRVVQGSGPDLAALEEIAGDHEGMRPALDGKRADARERLSLGGPDTRPDARIEARARSVEMAIRRVDDPQHGGRRLALRSAVTAPEKALPGQRTSGL